MTATKALRDNTLDTPEHSDPAAHGHCLAAMSAVQAILLALVESGAVDRDFLVEALGDAIARHRDADTDDAGRECRDAAAAALERLIADCEAADTVLRSANDHGGEKPQ